MPGEKYHDEHSVYEGRMQNHHWHSECLEAWQICFDEGESEFEPYSFKRGSTELKEEEERYGGYDVRDAML